MSVYIDNSASRRDFLKSLLAVPLIGTGLAEPQPQSTVGSNISGHKFKLSLNAYSFNTLLRAGKIDLFDLLDFCAAYNFDAIDPTGYYFPGYPAVPTDEFINEFKRKAFIFGLDISGTGVRNDFANPDPAGRKADIVMIKQWIIASAKLGAPALRVFASTNNNLDLSLRDRYFEWMAQDLKECCDFGKEYGVIIAVQNHNNLLKTSADINRLFQMVDSEWLGLNLDFGSYRTRDPYEETARNIQHAITWQIKENVWVDGRETPTDFEKLFKIIKNAGYRGYLPLETLGEGNPFKKVPILLDRVNKALQQI